MARVTYGALDERASAVMGCGGSLTALPPVFTINSSYGADLMAVGQKGTILGVLALAALVSGVVFETHPAAQELEEAEGPDEPEVSEKELQMYIDVYKAMQSDHSLTIESALTAQGVTVDEFRAVEQRIQRQERLVQNVRQALLEHSKAHAGAVQPPIGSATTGSTP